MDLKLKQQGSVAKFIVTSQDPHFNMEDDDFQVELEWGMLGRKLVIPKSEFKYGTGGEFIMNFSTAGMVGPVKARTVMLLHDTDIDPANERREVDLQIILFVSTTPCPRFLTCPICGSDTHAVRFELTDEPDIAEAYQRVEVTETVTPDSGGQPYIVYRPVITRDDQYVYVRRLPLEPSNNE